MRRANEKSKTEMLLQFLDRETGLIPPRTFSRRISASRATVEQIDLYGKLKGHNGCVNTVEFNSTGDLLVSGSDDRQIMLWDWAKQELKFSYPSGHLDNIFQAKIMPFTDDRIIVTSSADCQVRLGQLSDSGTVTKKLSKHHGRVHKLAVEPGSPYIFYSCGEDGFVQHYDLRCESSTKLFYCSSFEHPSRGIDLNAMVMDPRNPNYIAVGGADAYARVYDLRNYQINASAKAGIHVDSFCASHLVGTHDVHITALAYSKYSELLISYNDELIYLFQNNMGFGKINPTHLKSDDCHEMETPQVYSGHRNSRTVKGVNFFGPNDEYVVSGSDCGHIFIWKKKGGEVVRIMVGDKHIVNQLEAHPVIPVLATCGIEKSVKMWAPMSSVVRPLPDDFQEIMEANLHGREERSRVTLTPDVIMHVLRLHRRQARAYVEREDLESDEDEEEGGRIVLEFADGGGLEEGGNSRDCNIS